MPAKKSHSISVFLNQEYPSIVKSGGIYLYDDTGNGMTMGSLALLGFPFRRADYAPYLPSTYHIAPAYGYRCWFNKTTNSSDLECAQVLENEIMMQGAKPVAAFIAKPFSGMSLCAAAPRCDYFKKIREI